MRQRLIRLRALLPTLSKPAAKKTMAELLSLMSDIESARADLDPIKDQEHRSTPADPDTAGRLVALALIAQRARSDWDESREPTVPGCSHRSTAEITRSTLQSPARELRSTWAKPTPDNPNARTPREQGPRLFGRLKDQPANDRDSWRYAEKNGLPHPLRLDDFLARRLVCATNAQLVAERHLIAMFRPIWNNEIGICRGISKHGNAATTRSNKRSPWDVMHPGRAWAMAESLDNKASPEDIARRIAGTLKRNPPYLNTGHVVRYALSAFVQHASLSPDEPADNEDSWRDEEKSSE